MAKGQLRVRLRTEGRILPQAEHSPSSPQRLTGISPTPDTGAGGDQGPLIAHPHTLDSGTLLCTPPPHIRPSKPRLSPAQSQGGQGPPLAVGQRGQPWAEP